MIKRKADEMINQSSHFGSISSRFTENSNRFACFLGGSSRVRIPKAGQILQSIANVLPALQHLRCVALALDAEMATENSLLLIYVFFSF